jgi:hypothetical protein
VVRIIPVPILLVIASNGIVTLDTAGELQNLNPRLQVEYIQDAAMACRTTSPMVLKQW